MRTILLFMAIVAIVLMFLVSNATKELAGCLPQIPIVETPEYQELTKEKSCVVAKEEFDSIVNCLDRVREKSFSHGFFYEREKEHINKRRINHNERCVDYPTTLIQ